MFGFGLPELLVIGLAVVFLFSGEDKLSGLGRGLGRFTGEFKKGKDEIEKEIDKEIKKAKVVKK